MILIIDLFQIDRVDESLFPRGLVCFSNIVAIEVDIVGSGLISQWIFFTHSNVANKMGNGQQFYAAIIERNYSIEAQRPVMKMRLVNILFFPPIFVFLVN